MSDELIRLDTTIIGIDSLINKASTAEEAKVLFTVKDAIYSQQRYFTDVQPVKHGRWIKHSIDAPKSLLYGAVKDTTCSVCNKSTPYTTEYCMHCGARMDGDTNA